MDTTLIVNYYRNPRMLEHQVAQWDHYPENIRVIVLDDCSPEPAIDYIPESSRAEIYRITKDIPWNQNAARNLGAMKAKTDWIMFVDIDHVLMLQDAARLARKTLDPTKWYRFKRIRVGAADSTRLKDALPLDAKTGEIKPHINSFLCTKQLYWAAGGYDEDFAGSLGGATPFLRNLGKKGKAKVLQIQLHCFTRDAVPDANDTTLSRDTSRYRLLSKEKAANGNPKPTDWVRYPWVKAR